MGTNNLYKLTIFKNIILEHEKFCENLPDIGHATDI